MMHRSCSLAIPLLRFLCLPSPLRCARCCGIAGRRPAVAAAGVEGWQCSAEQSCRARVCVPCAAPLFPFLPSMELCALHAARHRKSPSILCSLAVAMLV